MQSQQPKLYLLHKRISAVFHTLAENYSIDSYLRSTPLSSVRVRDPANFVRLENIFLSGRVTLSLQADHGINRQELHKFRLKCLDFYIEGAAQIQRRFIFVRSNSSVCKCNGSFKYYIKISSISCTISKPLSQISLKE